MSESRDRAIQAAKARQERREAMPVDQRSAVALEEISDHLDSIRGLLIQVNQGVIAIARKQP